MNLSLLARVGWIPRVSATAYIFQQPLPLEIDWSSFTSITVSRCGQIVHLRLLAERPSPQRIFSRYYCDYCDTHLTHDSVSKTCPVTNARSLFFLSRHLSRRTAQFSRLLACICVCLQPRRIAPNRHCWHILLSSLDWVLFKPFWCFFLPLFFSLAVGQKDAQQRQKTQGLCEGIL